MSTKINIAEAKAKLSALLDRALGGEEIVIARAGKPLARLVPIKQPRKPGAWKHWKFDPDAILEPMDPEDLDAAEGKYSDEYGISLPQPRDK
jgi:prevent-host-death family protein